MLIPNGTDSKKEKNKQTQDIWVSNLEMGWNQLSHMLVWPVLGILLHRQENLPLSHYWLVNSGTRSYTEVDMIPMHMLSMCYHPASHIFATRVLSVHFLYPIHSHVMRIQLHFINWIQYPGTNSFNLCPSAFLAYIELCISSPYIVWSLYLCFHKLTASPLYHSAVLRECGHHLPSMITLASAVSPQPPSRRDLPPASDSSWGYICKCHM